MNTSIKSILAWFFLVGNMSLLSFFRITNLYFENFSFFTFFIASILFFIWLYKEQEFPVNVFVLMIFIYFLAILLSLLLSLYNTPSTLTIFITKALFFFFFSIIPFMSGALYKNELEIGRNLILFSLTIFITSFTIELAGQNSELYRAFSLAGNPISQALGLSALFLIFLNTNKLKENMSLYLVTLTISIVWIFSLGSRGVGISFILVVMIMNLFKYGKMYLNDRKIFNSIVSVLCISFLIYLLLQANLLSMNFIQNGWVRWESLFRSIVNQDISLKNLDTARYQYQQNAIEVFLNKWFLGDAMYDSLSGSYAHSIIFDSLARSGLLGSTALFICIITGSIYALKNISNSIFVAISGIFLMTVIHGLISASIFINPTFWFSLGFLISKQRNQLSLEGDHN